MKKGHATGSDEMRLERLAVTECVGICWTNGSVNTCKQLGPENCRYKKNKGCDNNSVYWSRIGGVSNKIQLPETYISLLLYNEFEAHQKGNSKVI